MPVIEGTGLGTPLVSAGAPVNGTDEVQTITFGGTPTDGDTFYLTFEGFRTADIEWTDADDAGLIAAIDAALGALPTINGAANVTVADGTLTAGIGTVTVTFVAAKGKQAQSLITATASAAFTTSGGTVGVAETTPGVSATGRGAPKGAKLVDTTNGIDYINTGTAAAPTWTKVGTQT